MSTRRKLAMMIGGALLLASAATYLLAAVLGILTSTGFGRRQYGDIHAPAQALVAGSSLAYDGVNWREVASVLGVAIESWPVPGSSPAEWEQFLPRSAQAKITFVGVSLYDLNEAWLCDFRANIVPISQTLTDLRESGSDMTFARRLMNGYPRAWVRAVFPTAGRADRVIFGFRDKARSIFGMANDPDGMSQLRLAGDYTSDDRLSDWPKDRLLRRLAAMRSVQGTPGFSGPKHLALRRLLQRASRQGKVVVVVLPVSRPYIDNLLRPGDIQQFEVSLAKARDSAPEARWVRLDRLSAFDSTDYFYDLVHLNMQGRRIASDNFLTTLAGTLTSQ